jgi:cell shape-determining protein MreC
MTSKYALRIFLAVLMLGAIFARGSFNEAAANLSAELRNAFSLPFLFVWRMVKSHDFALQIRDLELQNQSLRSELQMARLNLIPDAGTSLRAKIFATYPFNDRHAIFISKGTEHGVKTGAAALAAPGIFLGEVVRAEKTWSEIRTVFDGSRELPVRVGSAGAPGLLRGGSSVSVGMLDKSKKIALGDAVMLAKIGLPYGLKIGSVREIRAASGTVFNEAELALPYVLSELTEVLVIKE